MTQKKRKTKHNCTNCDKVVLRLPSQNPKGGKVFCNQKCLSEYNAKKRQNRPPAKISFDGAIEMRGTRCVCPKCGCLLKVFGPAYECVVFNEGTVKARGCGTIYRSKKELEKVFLAQKSIEISEALS